MSLFNNSITDYLFKNSGSGCDEINNLKNDKIGFVEFPPSESVWGNRQLGLFDSSNFILRVESKGILKTIYRIFAHDEKLLGTCYKKSNAFIMENVNQESENEFFLKLDFQTSKIYNENGKKIAHYDYDDKGPKRPRIVPKLYKVVVDDQGFDRKLLLGFTLANHFNWHHLVIGTP